MDIGHVNQLLESVMYKLESLDPQRIEEAQKRPSEQHPQRMSAARKRLQNLYDKLTKDRPSHTKVQATGSKRGQ